jgi:uncharacterized protein (TIGR03083 family)
MTASPGSGSTRLAPDRYLSLLSADGHRLAEVAEGNLGRPVPPCPGWDVDELVRHTAEVYNHKIACTVLGRRPSDDEYEHAPGEGLSLVDWFSISLSNVIETLGTRSPESPAYTWYDPEQDVAFWIRRMAQETVIHRIDAESAADSITAVDDDLAVDGIDEVLDIFVRWAVGDDPDEDVTSWDGKSWLVRTGPWAWHVTVTAGDPAGQISLRRASGHADATISGEPSELLLWLWGRRPASAVSVAGNADAVAPLRALLARATQ